MGILTTSDSTRTCVRVPKWISQLLQGAGVECLDAAGFVRGDIPILLQDPAELVDTFEQTGFGEAVDGEFDAFAIRQLDGLGGKIYCDFASSGRAKRRS